MLKKCFCGVFIIVFAVIFVSCTVLPGGPVRLDSPGKFKGAFHVKDSGAYYSVGYEGRTFIREGKLGIEFAESGPLGENLEIVDVKESRVNNSYTMVYGKTSLILDNYNQTVITLKEKKVPYRMFNIEFRLYTDGLAFRYIFPEQDALCDFTIVKETSQFGFTEDFSTYALELKGFTTNYESEFNPIKLSEITESSLIGLPILIKARAKDDIYVAIVEANLTDYAGMYVKGVKDEPFTLESALSPLPGANQAKVKASTPHRTPWRVIMIAEEPGRLVESNIILNLNEPCAIEDPSWIKPGKVAWDWWSGSYAKDVSFKYGMNTETMLHYIDFAGEHNIEYMLVDAKWYGDHHDPKADITTTIKEINMPKILDHAKKKNVGIILWIHWECTIDQMDKAFSLYEKWGVKGVKVDYMDRDDQEMVNVYRKIVKKAAEHRLLVDFHGAYKPTGIRRTYPNLITREGILALEYLKWSDRADPEHNVTIPFTRMLAGPMDYTPGGFLNATREQFTARRLQPMTLGTRCHQLAMYVIYESPFQMLCDYPGAYRNQAGFEFLKAVPVTWDETRVLNGEVADYITIARRNGEEWYVGSMTDWTPREFTIQMSFLGKGMYKAEIYQDALDANENPTNVVIKECSLLSSDDVVIKMATGGGFAMRIVPLEEGRTIPGYKVE